MPRFDFLHLFSNLAVEYQEQREMAKLYPIGVQSFDDAIRSISDRIVEGEG